MAKKRQKHAFFAVIITFCMSLLDCKQLDPFQVFMGVDQNVADSFLRFWVFSSNAKISNYLIHLHFISHDFSLVPSHLLPFWNLPCCFQASISSFWPAPAHRKNYGQSGPLTAFSNTPLTSTAFHSINPKLI